MNLDIRLIDKIENGQQLGQRLSFEINGETWWSSVGIQKWEGKYKVYVDEILESNMNAEEYQREEIISFENVDDALVFIDSNTHANLENLLPCKGQRIFNPRFG